MWGRGRDVSYWIPLEKRERKKKKIKNQQPHAVMLEISCQQLHVGYESWRQSKRTGFREERAALGLNQPVGQSPDPTLKQLQHRAAPSPCGYVSQ